MPTYYTSTVRSIGEEAEMMIEEGVLILFGTPCPEALAEVSVVHEGGHLDEGVAPAPGDVIRLGGAELEIAAVGEIAGQNLRELGHIVLYQVKPDGPGLLPGAVHVHGALAAPAVGSVIEFATAEA